MVAVDCLLSRCLSRNMRLGSNCHLGLCHVLRESVGHCRPVSWDAICCCSVRLHSYHIHSLVDEAAWNTAQVTFALPLLRLQAKALEHVRLQRMALAASLCPEDLVAVESHQKTVRVLVGCLWRTINLNNH